MSNPARRPSASIRPAEPDDAQAVVALRTLVLPFLVRGVASTRQMIATPTPGLHWAGFVAEVDGKIIGWVSASRNEHTTEAVGEVSLLHVHPDQRRRGIGAALLARALEHLAPLDLDRLHGRALPEALPFARRHGFAPSRQERFSALDLHALPPLPETPDGVRLLSLAEADPRQVHRVDVLASADEPGVVASGAIGYDHWCAGTWDNVGLDREASMGAEVGGVLAAISLVKRDGERMWTDYTGTVPEHRGRGLARLVKLAALHRAAARGITVAYTGNDEANAPMLAINTRLGYRQVASQWSCVRELRPTVSPP
ncbi:GNAT family N-acetyltransferase [Micromonospora sp. WMMD1082]|uniref:GNAT family N-acetyltransferase n=1 Tax=Micromonospora sp. WMMD1082 TaxID=3016104 RepID=UPI002416596E|nr:GNAT family N-acetyltransferase [Micromonospora sp. WMMD1082]MDG4794180.1 GNAT family N-acetyltransferase [Micromonospora sp. WMMD1082]